jgi:hypothetical protein
MTSDDYYTPAWLFERMGITFDLDVCAPPGGVPWIPAAQFFTMADDGLAQEWSGRVWMNPPYSNATPWVDRFVNHAHGVCLVQVSKGRYSDHLWGTADAVVLVRDIRFVTGVSGLRSDIYMPLWVAAFGDECVEAIARLGVVRKAA